MEKRKNKEKQTKKRREVGSIVVLLKFFIFHFSFFISLSSCTDDPVGGSSMQEERDILFSMRIPGSTSGTRTMNATDETTIQDIFVLVFDPVTETFEYLAAGSLQPGSGTTRSFTVTLRSGTFDLIILANAGGWITASYPTGIPTGEHRSAIETTLSASLGNTEKWNTQSGSFTPIPFSGEKKNVTIDATTDLTTSPLSLIRGLAAINVEVATAARSTFKLQSIHLYNHRAGGLLIADETKYQAGAPTPTGTLIREPLVYSGSEITTTDISSVGEIYTFEAGKGTLTGFLDNTSLVIGGNYGAEGTSYYRVDFTETASDGTVSYMPLLRNHKYTVTIKAVTQAGWPTADQAFKALPANMKAEILSWEEGYDENLDIGGQQTFTLSESYLVFPGINDDEGTPFTGSIKVKSTLDWSYELSTSPTTIEGDVSSWFTSTRQSNTKEDIIDFTIKENKTNRRLVYIHFKTGNVTQVATILQRRHHDPNSYILTPGGELEFLVRKAYTVWADEILGDQKQALSGAVTCGVIWQDVQDLVNVTLNADGDKGEKTKLLVKANGTNTGNAVVGVYIDGTLRYSWHIWVTDYDPDRNSNGTTYLYNNGYQDYLFMDRNLGATTATPGEATTLGLLYQWGRKDPFTGVSAINSATEKVIYGTQIQKVQVPVGRNLHNTLLYPYRYYFNTTNPSDWYAINKNDGNDYLWLNEYDYDKGIFDPCPEGWRVPDFTRDIEGVARWSPWLFMNNKLVWNPTYQGNMRDNDFFPLAGFRGHTNGRTSPSWGCYWSASPINTFGSRMYFANNNFVDIGANARAYGYSVRCVQDL